MQFCGDSHDEDERSFRRSAEHGFTLIELMVVITIIGILIAVLTPTLLGARGRAEDRAAEANLRTGLVTAKTYYTDEVDFTGFDPTTAKEVDASLRWVAPGPPVVGEVAIVDVTPSTALLVAQSGSGTFFCIFEDGTAGTFFNSGSTFAAVDTPPDDCDEGSW